MKALNVNVDPKNGKKKKRNLSKFESSILLNSSSKSEKRKEKVKKILRKAGKVLLVVFIIALILSPFVYQFLYKPAMKLQDSIYVLVEQSSKIKTDFKEQDLVALKSDYEGLDAQVATVKENYEYFKFLKSIPVARGYYINGEHIFNAAQLGVPVGQDLIDTATPIADVFGYKTESGMHEEVGGQEKIETIIRNMPDISTAISESRPQIDQVLDELNAVNPRYIPEEIKGYKLKEMYQKVSSTLSEGKEIMSDLQQFLDVLPNVAGAPEAKTYLILFQNDKEIRPTGGFLTAFGYANVENGKLGEIESEDIYNLDQALYSYETAPVEIQEYLAQSEWHIRDVNIHTDLVSASLKFEEQYENQANPRPFDGIIYIDTQFVERLMEVTGPIEMNQYGTTIDADNVVYELEVYSEKILSGGTDRKQFMEDLMGELVSRLLEANRDMWGGLIEAAVSSLESKHLMFYFHDQTIQTLASKYNLTGEINMDWDHDYLHISESNMGGLKSNFYVTSNVRQEVEVDKGEVLKTVKIHWENPEPSDHWLNGPYRNWVRIYVPYGSELISGDVKEREMNEEWNESNYGKTVFDAFITVPTAESEESEPGTYDLEFTYKLPDNIVQDDMYKLLIQKQPGKPSEDYVIRVNGQEQLTALDKDTEVEMKL